MRDGPPDDPALIRVPELARAGNHTETIDHNGQIIRLGVVPAPRVCDELAEAVDAALAAVDGKFLGNAVDGMKSGGALLDGNAIPGLGIVLEARCHFAARESVQTIRAVHAVRAPEDQGNAARAGVFENPDGAETVVRDVEERIRITGDDGGLGACVANQLDARG